MPEATLDAVADHGQIPDDSIHGTYDQSQGVLRELAALGIDYHNVVQVLEDQGVSAFEASWDQLGQRLATALQPGPDAARSDITARKDRSGGPGAMDGSSVIFIVMPIVIR